jgi:hypothetical protein
MPSYTCANTVPAALPVVPVAIPVSQDIPVPTRG